MDKRRLTDSTLESGVYGLQDADRSTNDVALVAFELPATVPATTVSVCGDFNGWKAETHPLTRLADGRFRTEIVLPAGERWRFRYLVDGERWENDPTADGHVPNGLGTEDCVVDLTDPQFLSVVDSDTSAEGDGGVVRRGPSPGLQRVRLRRKTWERIEAEAAARGVEPHDVIADVLEALAGSSGDHQ